MVPDDIKPKLFFRSEHPIFYFCQLISLSVKSFKYFSFVLERKLSNIIVAQTYSYIFFCFIKNISSCFLLTADRFMMHSRLHLSRRREEVNILGCNKPVYRISSFFQNVTSCKIDDKFLIFSS